MKNLFSTPVLQLPNSSLEAKNTISFFILPEMFYVRRKKTEANFINWGGGCSKFQKYYSAISFYMLIFIESPWQHQPNLSSSIIGDIKIVS